MIRGLIYSVTYIKFKNKTTVALIILDSTRAVDHSGLKQIQDAAGKYFLKSGWCYRKNIFISSLVNYRLLFVYLLDAGGWGPQHKCFNPNMHNSKHAQLNVHVFV